MKDRARVPAIPRLLKAKEVAIITSLSRVMLPKLVTAGEFPAPLRLSETRFAWRETDIQDWIDSRPPMTWAA